MSCIKLLICRVLQLDWPGPMLEEIFCLLRSAAVREKESYSLPVTLVR